MDLLDDYDFPARTITDINIPSTQGSLRIRCGSGHENPKRKNSSNANKFAQRQGGLCSQRNKTKRGRFCLVEQLWSSFFCWSKACFLSLAPRAQRETSTVDLPIGATLTYLTFNARNFLSFEWIFRNKASTFRQRKDRSNNLFVQTQWKMRRHCPAEVLVADDRIWTGPYSESKGSKK